MFSRPALPARRSPTGALRHHLHRTLHGHAAGKSGGLPRFIARQFRRRPCKVKLLIVHATGDDNVHFANTVELAEKLVDAAKVRRISDLCGPGPRHQRRPGPHSHLQPRHAILHREPCKMTPRPHPDSARDQDNTRGPSARARGSATPSSPSLATGTVNCAAKAAVFVHC